jgi:hypothetical protein
MIRIASIGQAEFNAKTRRRRATDAATKEFEQEQTEKKQREGKTLSKMRNSWG